MKTNVPGIVFSFIAVALCFSLSSTYAVAETLNPEGVNPHVDAPRKRITQKQKQAAAEAMKKKKAEIEARKAAEAAKSSSPSIQNSQTPN